MIPGGLMSNGPPAQVLAHAAPSWGQLLQPPSWQPVLLPPLTLAPLMASTLPSLQKHLLSGGVTPWALVSPRSRHWDVSLTRERYVWGSIITRWRSELHRKGSWPIKTVSASWARLSAWHMIDGLSLGNTYCTDINADEIQIQKTSMSVFQKLTKPLSKNCPCLIHSQFITLLGISLLKTYTYGESYFKKAYTLSAG